MKLVYDVIDCAIVWGAINKVRVKLITYYSACVVGVVRHIGWKLFEMSFFCISLFRKKGSRRRALEEWNQEHKNLVQVPLEPLSHPETMRVLRLNANRIRELPKVWQILTRYPDFTTPVLYTQAVFNLQLLTHLDLSDNDIAYLPPAISRLVNLEYLDLSKNG